MRHYTNTDNPIHFPKMKEPKAMKHFNALTEVENEVIRLAEMRKLLSVITNGMEGSTRDEIESAIHYIEGSISDISEQLSERFQLLFDSIAREDDE